ncbi:dTDP-4-dehydrorhamnose reductase [Simiduia aestuariiviva]|uniref:dTDP-4-dehydrorhamnose reductase n=1 Tax=Simiduia aestuariiviva TaxID=1510459 RepID=A0A839UQE9_9GAMM|nr:dTDP-4-dehydrorhamnose reductase [Simiduia aestuariiviva]MBB3170013.1 dTDP-4-dehydrorhamnose reductase [Simiduia aestuariiviva]
MQTILLLGATGQVGQALLASRSTAYALVMPSRTQVNVETPGALANAVAAHNPHLVINCVAYNQVDGAEQNPELAARINAAAVAELAQACGERDIPLIHFSTDYVFAGKNPRGQPPLYTEIEPPLPVNHYGKTKLAGERAALQYPRNLVLRVSWVFSEFAQNMGRRIIQQAATGQPLAMACDQYGSPTYAGHIAQTVWALVPALMQGEEGGLYHLSGTAAASRYELAEALLAAAQVAGLVGSDCALTSVTQQDFMARSVSPIAERPQWSALGTEKLAQRLGRPLPHWRAGVELTVAGLARNLAP